MAIKKVIEIEVDADQAQKEVKDLGAAINQTQADAKAGTEATATAMDGLNEATGGAVAGAQKMLGAVKALALGFNGLKVAIIATGIGALIVGIIAVKEAFTRSEAGQDKYAKLMGIIGTVTNSLIDNLAKLGDFIIGVFENPKKSLQEFGDLLKSQIVNRVTGMLELLPALGKAISLAFSGEFGKAAKVAVDAVGKVTLGIENTTDKVNGLIASGAEYIEQQKEIAKQAAKVAGMRDKADDIERGLIVKRAAADKKRADLLVKGVDAENYSLQQRIEFLREAGRIDEEITKKEIEAAKLKYEAKKLENSLTLSTEEALIEEQRLKAAIIELDSQRLMKAKATTAQINGLVKQENAIQEQAIAEKTAAEKAAATESYAIEAKRLDDIAALQKSYEQKLLEAKAESNLEKVTLQADAAIAELDALNASEEQKAAAIAYWSGEGTKAILADKDAIKKAEQEELNFKLDTAKQAAETIALIAGENTKIAQAAAIAGVIIDGAKAIIGTWAGYASMGPFGVAAAAIQTAFIAATAVKSINTIKKASKGSTPMPNTGSPQTANRAVQSPEFNTVGQTGANQIASAINQNNEPIKAYVVSSEVSTAQALDRKIINNAKF